jgi:putative glutamine amidotransferase
MTNAKGPPPRIGITTYGRNDEGRFTLPAKYVDAVRRAAGLPLLLPPGEPFLDEWLALVDALILTGGPDVDPDLYRGAKHPEVYGIDRERDASDIKLARHAVETKMPALCICRGAQVLNVALGGTLVEHLPDVVGDKVPHRGKERAYVPHAVRIDAGSRLAKLLDATEMSPASSHHQAIRDAGRGLDVVARAPDGTIEAVEMRDHPWLFAVQWHPEYTAAEDAQQQKLFDALVDAARRRRAQRQA